jgi:hypothetical protein
MLTIQGMPRSLKVVTSSIVLLCCLLTRLTGLTLRPAAISDCSSERHSSAGGTTQDCLLCHRPCAQAISSSLHPAS